MTFADVCEEIINYCDTYDVDEETRIMIDSPGAPSIRAVLEDCEEKADLLSELSCRLSNYF